MKKVRLTSLLVPFVSFIIFSSKICLVSIIITTLLPTTVIVTASKGECCSFSVSHRGKFCVRSEIHYLSSYYYSGAMQLYLWLL